MAFEIQQRIVIDLCVCFGQRFLEGICIVKIFDIDYFAVMFLCFFFRYSSSWAI